MKSRKTIVKLSKAQYGCVESARLWYSTLSAHLKSTGFEVSAYDQCTFQRKNSKGEVLYAATYVDDTKAICESQDELNLFQSQLESVFW